MHVCVPKLFAGWLIPACLLTWPSLIRAQARPLAALPTAPGLSQLVRNAGYIFTGTVRSIERVVPSGSNEVATMRITFQVGQAIRGVQAGQTLVIHEWAGLWESGPRYRRGEHILLFLYHPSRLGLTSTVGGPMGRFNVDQNGQVILRQTEIDALWPSSVGAVLRPGGTAIRTQDFARAIQLAGRQ
jgi:hypothetical protein